MGLIEVCICVQRVLWYLGGEVMLLQLSPLPQVPGPDGVVQASGPQFGPIIRNVYTTGPISVALELPAGN